jgi:hypothetical protein
MCRLFVLCIVMQNSQGQGQGNGAVPSRAQVCSALGWPDHMSAVMLPTGCAVAQLACTALSALVSSTGACVLTLPAAFPVYWLLFASRRTFIRLIFQKTIRN